MVKHALIPERRRQRFPDAHRVALDGETRRVGRLGIAAARRELGRHGCTGGRGRGRARAARR